MKRTELNKVKKILRRTLHLDEESINYIVGSLNIGLEKKLPYFKFRLRTDMLKVLEEKYPVTYAGMEKHLSLNIKESWSLVNLDDAYRDLGIHEKPTAKIVVMLLLEKIQKNEL